MKEVRIAIIGTGIIAHTHLQSYKDLEGVTVVAACDILEDKLDKFCDKYDIPDRYIDYRELLKRDDIDAVDVCVHNNLHTPLAVAVLQSGKHCYCEKPLSGSYKDAAAIVEAAKKYDKMLHIQLAFLYSHETHAAKKLIEDGVLGNIYHSRSYGYRRRGRPFVDGYAEKEFNSSYWAAGGALYDMGVYHISCLLYLLNLPKVSRISGAVYQELSMDTSRQKESGFDVEELGVGFVKFEGGSTLDILESWAINAVQFPPSMICGSKAGISLAAGSKLELISEQSGYPTVSALDIGAEVYRTHQINPALNSMDSSQAHWVAALRKEVPLLNTAEIALQTMLISEGIYMSSKLGHEVSSEDVVNNSVSTAITKQETCFGMLEYSW